MNNRFLLYVAFSLVLFMVWQQWKIEQNPLPSTTKISEAQNNAEAFVDMPDEAIRDKKSETIKNVNAKLQNNPKTIKNNNTKLKGCSVRNTIIHKEYWLVNA